MGYATTKLIIYCTSMQKTLIQGSARTYIMCMNGEKENYSCAIFPSEALCITICKRHF